jgi:hypothetical protein
MGCVHSTERKQTKTSTPKKTGKTKAAREKAPRQPKKQTVAFIMDHSQLGNSSSQEPPNHGAGKIKERKKKTSPQAMIVAMSNPLGPANQPSPAGPRSRAAAQQPLNPNPRRIPSERNFAAAAVSRARHSSEEPKAPILASPEELEAPPAQRPQMLMFKRLSVVDEVIAEAAAAAIVIKA